jgi:hypothetical protein
VGKNGKGRVTLAAVVDESLAKVIDARRGGMTLSRSAYVGLILENWKALGYPPVNSADVALLKIAKISKGEGAGRKRE